MEATQSPLVAWQTFFFLVGSSAAGLTGLQFVVIALIAESRRRATTKEIDAFTTPTILHFCAVLLIAAIISAPWHGLLRVAFALGSCGLAGVVYSFVVMRRASRQVTYQPVLEDWVWHSVLPLIAYTLVFSMSFILDTSSKTSAVHRWCNIPDVAVYRHSQRLGYSYLHHSRRGRACKGT